MPPHSSHFLQPLDVACFSPLKRAYGAEISDLIRSHINHITKIEFLPAYYAAHQRSITKENICAGFQAAGLVPHNPEAVLSRLDVRLCTPPPPAIPEAPWESHTPGNARELDAQSTLVRNQIQRHQDSSPTSIISAFDHLIKGARGMGYELVLLRDRVSALEKANEAAIKRRQRKRKRLQKGGTLTLVEGEELIA
jgi:hypothetical protein